MELIRSFAFRSKIVWYLEFCLFTLLFLTQNGSGSSCICRLTDGRTSCNYYNMNNEFSPCSANFDTTLVLNQFSNDLLPLIKAFINDNNDSDVYYLNVSANNLAQIDFSWLAPFPHLMKLNLSNNQIFKFNYDKNKSVKLKFLSLIDLSHNKLSILDVKYFDHMKLQNLNLSFNTVTRFIGTFSVTHLNLQNNNLRNINDQFFQNLTQLKALDLQYNTLSEIGLQLFSNLTNLEFLAISHNNISFLHYKTFSNLERLTKLELQYNQLFELDSRLLHNLIHLNYLDMSYNSLESIHHESFHTLTYLKYLDISHNQIEGFHVFTFQYLPSLNTLSINDNQIESFYIDDILSYSKNLNKIFLDNNAWGCKNLSELIQKCHTGAIIVTPGKVYNQSNVLGVACRNAEEFSDQNSSQQKPNVTHSFCSLLIVCIVLLSLITIFVAVQTFINLLRIYKPKRSYGRLELSEISE